MVITQYIGVGEKLKLKHDRAEMKFSDNPIMCEEKCLPDIGITKYITRSETITRLKKSFIKASMFLSYIFVLVM